jgi:pectin methylesterase-like acyl-CoA thioesterase
LPPATIKAQSKTIVVPDDYSTIQSAIDNASAGETIFVKKRTYNERSLVINKTLTLVGEDANNTIIHNVDNPWLNWNGEFPPPATTTIEVLSDNVTISNLTLRNASANIIAYGDHIQITNNTITSGYVHLEGNNNQLLDNIFETKVEVNLNCVVA